MVLLLPLLSSSSSSGSKPSLQIFSDGSSSSPLFLFLLLDMFLERGFWILHCYCALITEILCEILEPLGSNCWLLKTKKLHFNANQLSLCLHSQDPSLGLPMQMGLYVMADMTFLLRTEVSLSLMTRPAAEKSYVTADFKFFQVSQNLIIVFFSIANSFSSGC